MFGVPLVISVQGRGLRPHTLPLGGGMTGLVLLLSLRQLSAALLHDHFTNAVDMSQSASVWSLK